MYIVREELLDILDRQLSFQDLPTSEECLLQTSLPFTESRFPTNPLPEFSAAVDGLSRQIEKPEPRQSPREGFLGGKAFSQFQCKLLSMCSIILSPVR